MKNIITLVASILFVELCTAQSNTDATNDLVNKVENGLTSNVVYIEGDVTSSIEERMKHYGVPGVSIAVIHKGEVVWAKGYGVVDKESKAPVTKETLFQASFLSMPVTAYGTLRLVEQKKVTLNEDINSYLKSWKLPANKFTKEKKATIKNLLNHSAGINLHAIPGYSTDLKAPTLVEILNGIPPVKNDPVLVNKEPDKSIYISGAGYAIIQQMMIDVVGKKFPELMNALVLQPLEMTNSTFNQPLSTEQLTKAATGYLQDGSVVKGKRHIYPAMASKGLWTTAEDFAKFMTNIHQTLKENSTKGLSKDMTALMLTPYGVSGYGPSFKYGLGFNIINREDEIYFRKNGWTTGFYSEMVAHRDKGYGVVVLTNSTFPEFNAEVMRSVALAYDWDHYIPVHQKMEIEQAITDKIIGKYQLNTTTVEVFQKDNLLFYKNILDVKAEELVKVSDSGFIRRNSSRLIQFKPNSENKKVDLLYINRNDKTIAGTFVKMDADKKEPIEFLLEGDFEKALQAYKDFIEQDPTHPTVDVEYIDDVGERFFHQNRVEIALNAFKLNTKLYPDRFQVYDSYANYCEQAGKIELAILNYSKSIELNPQNNGAKERIKELQKSK